MPKAPLPEDKGRHIDSTMIILEQVSKTFKGFTAVDRVSFTVEQGETFVLLGTSGCGKTTTLRMINRLIQPSSGTIFIDGKDIGQYPADLLRRNIGYVLQRNSLFPHYTVAENISIVPHLLKWDKAKAEARVHLLLEKLHLPDSYAGIYPEQLSGGEAQRVNLARALAADPPVLLMDEPFSALDTLTRVAIRKEFRELDELKQKTILMVTHDIQEAFELGDRICLMDKGKVMQIGTPETLLLRPANTFVRDFFSDAYTQLLFSVVYLRDILPYLAENTTTENNGYIIADPSETLAQALSRLKDKNDPNTRLIIQHRETQTSRTATWQELLGALSRYQIQA